MGSDLLISGFIEKKLGYVLVIAAVFHFAFSFIAPMLENYQTARIIAAACLSIFVIFHGTYRYKWKSMIVFITVAFLVSWTLETISINTGFPFGNYYYTELLGAKAGVVPWGIMLAYFFTGYIAWTMATIFINETGRGIMKRSLFWVPFIAALLMVSWNMCFDPIFSTIEGNWIWESSGGYFGVPITNFFGWFLTSYIIFQVFAFFLYKFDGNEFFRPKKQYWYLIPVVFIGHGTEYLISPFIKTENTEIYHAAFFTTLFTMILFSVTCICIIIWQNKQSKTKN